MAATMTRDATGPDRRSLLDRFLDPTVLLGALVAAFALYANVKSHSYGYDFRGGAWAAGRDVLAGRSPYEAPDTAAPFVSSIVLGQPDGLLTLGVALGWRYRSSLRGAAAVGTVIPLLLFLSSPILWLRLRPQAATQASGTLPQALPARMA